MTFTAPYIFATQSIVYDDDPPTMAELADRVGELKAAKADIEAYLDRMKAIFSASGLDTAEGVLFRVVLGVESVSAKLDRAAIQADMGEPWLRKYLSWGKPSRTFNCYARTAKAKRALSAAA